MISNRRRKRNLAVPSPLLLFACPAACRYAVAAGFGGPTVLELAPAARFPPSCGPVLLLASHPPGEQSRERERQHEA